MDRTNSLNLRYNKVREEDRQGISMINVIMTKETNKIGLDQTVEIGEFHLVVGYNVDQIREIDQDMSKTLDMTLEEEISEGM